MTLVQLRRSMQRCLTPDRHTGPTQSGPPPTAVSGLQSVDVLGVPPDQVIRVRT